jgi:pimeloyl-[acyl-carrier protein] methyl ester esterase
MNGIAPTPHRKDMHPATEDRKVPLVLLPALDGAGFSFQLLLGQLPSFIEPRLLRFPDDQALGYEELLPLVMRSLPDSPFILLGESFSTPLAIMIAAARSQGLRGLILCSAFARNPLWLSPNWLAHLCHPFIFRLYDPYIRLKVWKRGGGQAGVERLAALTKDTPKIIAKRAQSALRINVLKQLASCQVPVLYIRGTRDRMIHPRNLSEMSRCLPTMRVVQLDGGHCVLRSRAALAAAAIGQFITECDPSSCCAESTATESDFSTLRQ